MFLIDKPFVSDFLIETIKENNFRVVSTTGARELIRDNSLNWISEEEAILFVEKNPETPIYTNSENTIGWMAANLGTSKRYKQIQLFKDKVKFRDLVKDTFPGFSYQKIAINEIQKLDSGELRFPFVIKPALGFFSLGVHIIHNSTDWNRAKRELNYENLQSIYPKEVLDTTTFIIEDYIEGEEFAVDFYYNNTGEVVILNIMHHKFSSGTDISDRVYSTSTAILEKYKSSFDEFLQPIGVKSGLRNFPAHIEIRVDESGKIVPIEMNPMRFGGWCTTGDLAWNAFGINSYEYFIQNRKPDWQQVISAGEAKAYSIIVLNNSSGIAASEITDFDYERLSRDFENAFIIRKLNVKEYSFFGFVFAETSRNNLAELENILVSDLKKYIKSE